MSEPVTELVSDLHCHSTCSDGELTPVELVRRAKERDVQRLALTDHDTLDGIEQARSEAVLCDIDFVPGCEISTLWQRLELHVVALNIDVTNPLLLDGLEQQNQARWLRAEQMAQRLMSKHQYEDLLPRAVELAGGRVPGRPHFAKAIVETGRLAKEAMVFKRYLGNGKSAHVPTQWASLESVVQWIHSAGGLAVLAHPCRYGLTRTKLKKLVQAFKLAGGDGLEVSLPNMPDTQRSSIANMAAEFDLLASQGSDFHRPCAWLDLGAAPPLPATLTPVWARF